MASKSIGFKKLSVVLILAMIAVIALSAAPAFAATSVYFANGQGVTIGVAIPGQPTTYEVSFTTSASGGLTAGTDTISITFPSGTGINATTSTGIEVNKSALSSAPTVSGTTITMVTPVAVAPGGAVTVSFSSGVITNPTAQSANYTVQVYTSKDTAPATSPTYTVGNKISSPSFNPVPTTAGANADVTVSGTATTALTANNDTISVTFPTGTTLPASISPAAVRVNGVAPNSAPSVSGNTVTVTTPVNINSSFTVEFYTAAGIKNPSTAGSGTAYVFTSQDAIPVSTTVTYAAAASGVSNASVQLTNNFTGQLTGFTITFTATSGVKVGDTIYLSIPTASTTGNISISNLTVNNAAVSSVSGTVSSSGSLPLAITSPVSVAAGGNVTVVIPPPTSGTGGIENPASAGSYNVVISTTADAAPVNASYSIVAAGTKVTLASGTPTVTPLLTGATADYQIDFTTSSSNGALAAGSTITVTFPSGCTVPSTIPYTSIKLGGNTVPANVSVNGNTVTVTLPTGYSVASGSSTSIEFTTAAGIKNPATPGSGSLTIYTSSDTLPQTASITFSGPTSVSSLSASLSSYVAAASSSYTITFTPTNWLTSGSSVSVTFPAGTGLSEASASLSDNGAGSYNVGNLSINGNTLTIPVTGVTTGTGATEITLTINKVTNPATAGAYYLTLSTSLDTQPATAAYSIYATAPSGSVSGLNVIPSTSLEGANAQYTVNFKVQTALTAGTDTISVIFPAGSTVPASIPASDVTVNGTALTAAPTVNGNTVTFTTPVAVSANGAVSVLFAASAGITNPNATPGTYAVSTSKDNPSTTQVTFSTTSTAVSNVTLSVNPAATNTAADYKVGFTTSGALTAGTDVIDVTFNGATVASEPPVTDVLVNGIAAYKVGVTGTSTMQITVPVNISAGQAVQVEFLPAAGITTPASSATPVSVSVAINGGSPVTSPNVTLGATTLGGTGTLTVAPNAQGSIADWKISGLTASTALTANKDTISVTFENTVSLPSSIPAGAITVNGTAVTAAPTVSGQTVTFTTPVAVPVGSGITVEFLPTAGILVPAPDTNNKVTVSMYTSQDTNPTASIGATISPTNGTKITGLSFSASNSSIKANANYTITFTTTSGINPGDAINVILPGFDATNFTQDTGVTVNGISATSDTFATSTSTLAITAPAYIPAGGQVTVNIPSYAGLFNPASVGTYTVQAYTKSDPYPVSTSYNVTAGAANTLNISAPPAATIGVPVYVTVTVKDASGNTVTSFNDPVKVTSTDSKASIGSAVFVKGVATIQVTFNTAGSQTITVTDANNSNITATSSAVSVLAPGGGYTILGADGGIFNFGDSQFSGSVPGLGLGVPVKAVGVAQAGNGKYWVLGSDGGVFTFGNGQGFYGSLPGIGVSGVNPVQIVATPDAKGYWILTDSGKVYNFGDAGSYGDASGKLNSGAKAVGMACTADGKGYYIAASDGSVYAFGDAVAAANPTLKSGTTATSIACEGSGYLVLGSDGEVYAEGGATYYGDPVNTNGLTINGHAVQIVPTIDGQGYYILGSDGGIFTYGDATFYGSLPGLGINNTSIALGVTP